jgi:hypothetical protein
MSKEFEVPGFKPGVLVAAADLSSYQYRAVKLNTSGEVALCGAGEAAIGILQNKPVAGEACEIDMDGISKAVMGATIANAGGKLASDANGKLVAAVSTNYVVAQLLTTAAADGVISSVKVIGSAGQLLA